jgi:hypothetical protein
MQLSGHEILAQGSAFGCCRSFRAAVLPCEEVKNKIVFCGKSGTEFSLTLHSVTSTSVVWEVTPFIALY